MKLKFTAERQKRFDSLVAKYEQRRSALLPTLYLAQEQWGYLSDEALTFVAGLLDMPPREVFEAASFYILFRRKDMGRYCLQVCNNITCTMMGSEKILSLLRQELGIGPNEVTADRNFSVVAVQCLGSCSTAPVVQVNEEYFENMTEERLKTLLGELKDCKPTRVCKSTL